MSSGARFLAAVLVAVLGFPGCALAWWDKPEADYEYGALSLTPTDVTNYSLLFDAQFASGGWYLRMGDFRVNMIPPDGDSTMFGFRAPPYAVPRSSTYRWRANLPALVMRPPVGQIDGKALRVHAVLMKSLLGNVGENRYASGGPMVPLKVKPVPGATSANQAWGPYPTSSTNYPGTASAGLWSNLGAPPAYATVFRDNPQAFDARGYRQDLIYYIDVQDNDERYALTYYVSDANGGYEGFTRDSMHLRSGWQGLPDMQFEISSPNYVSGELAGGDYDRTDRPLNDGLIAQFIGITTEVSTTDAEIVDAVLAWARDDDPEPPRDSMLFDMPDEYGFDLPEPEAGADESSTVDWGEDTWTGSEIPTASVDTSVPIPGWLEVPFLQDAIDWLRERFLSIGGSAVRLVRPITLFRDFMD